jgi:hypothetical protein
MISYEYYYDVSGRFIFAPAILNQTMEYSNKASSYNFKKSDVNFINGVYKFDFSSIFNHVCVFGTNASGELISNESIDNYIFSDTRVDLIGDRLKVIEDENISSIELCKTRSDYELFRAIRIKESCEIESLVLDFILENQIVTLPNIISEIQERYLINSVDWQSTSDTMTISIWKIRDIN